MGFTWGDQLDDSALLWGCGMDAIRGDGEFNNQIDLLLWMFEIEIGLRGSISTLQPALQGRNLGVSLPLRCLELHALLVPLHSQSRELLLCLPCFGNQFFLTI